MTWYDDNQLRAYPLVGHDDLRLPHDILVDALVTAPNTLGSTAQLISMSVTPLLTSALLGIDGTVVASVTIQGRPEPGLPYDLAPVVAGVSGFVAFGAGAALQTLRVDGPLDLVPQTCVLYTPDPTNGTLAVGGHTIQGPVQLTVSPDLNLSTRTVRLYDPAISQVRTVVAAVISAATPSVLHDPIPACLRFADGVLGRIPLRQINGVAPSTSGDLTITFVEARQTADAPNVVPVALTNGVVLQDSGLTCQGDSQ